MPWHKLLNFLAAISAVQLSLEYFLLKKTTQWLCVMSADMPALPLSITLISH
jgi:hypothetical protein